MENDKNTCYTTFSDDTYFSEESVKRCDAKQKKIKHEINDDITFRKNKLKRKRKFTANITKYSLRSSNRRNLRKCVTQINTYNSSNGFYIEQIKKRKKKKGKGSNRGRGIGIGRGKDKIRSKKKIKKKEINKKEINKNKGRNSYEEYISDNRSYLCTVDNLVNKNKINKGDTYAYIENMYDDLKEVTLNKYFMRESHKNDKSHKNDIKSKSKLDVGNIIRTHKRDTSRNNKKIKQTQIHIETKEREKKETGIERGIEKMRQENGKNKKSEESVKKEEIMEKEKRKEIEKEAKINTNKILKEKIESSFVDKLWGMPFDETGIETTDNVCYYKFTNNLNNVRKFIFPFFKYGDQYNAKQQATVLKTHMYNCPCCLNGILCNYVEQHYALC